MSRVLGQLASTVLRGDRHSNVTVLPDRSCRPVKVQQRTSGGAWRTLTGLTDFAIVASYLDTANKWGHDKLDALHQLFTTGPWTIPHPA